MRTCAVFLLLIGPPAWPQWSPVNDPVGLITEALLQEDSVLYAGTNLGIYRSRDAGMVWERTGSGYSSSGFAVSGPWILARSTAHVIRTRNQGDTWETAHAGLAETHARAIFSFGDRVFLATENGVHASSDHGDSWQPSHAGMEDSMANGFASEGRWLLAFTPSGLYRSADTGRTWVRSGTGLPALLQSYWPAIARSQGRLFASTQGIFQSRDSGATWEPIAGANLDSTVYSIFDVGEDLFVGSQTGLYRSSDAGATFAKVGGEYGYQHQPFAAARRGGEWVLATTQGVFGTVDRGATWQARNTGIGVSQVRDILSLGGDLWAAAGEKGLHRTSDRGESWSRIPIPAVQPISLAASGDTLFVGTSNGILVSVDRGTTWRILDTEIERGMNRVLELVCGGGNIYGLINNSRGYQVYQARTVQVSGWSPCGNVPGHAQDLLLQGNTLYVATDSGIVVSNDDCRTWSPSPILPGGKAVSRIAAQGRYLAAAGSYGVFRSANGADWIRVDSLPGTLPGSESWASLSGTSAGFFAGTYGGRIRFSGDSGATWITLSESLRPVSSSIQAFAVHEGEIYAGTIGIYKRPISGVQVGTRRQGNPRVEPRSRLRSALRVLRAIGADLLGRYDAPGASRGP